MACYFSLSCGTLGGTTLLSSAAEDGKALLWTMSGRFIGMFGQVQMIAGYMENNLVLIVLLTLVGRTAVYAAADGLERHGCHHQRSFVEYFGSAANGEKPQGSRSECIGDSSRQASYLVWMNIVFTSRHGAIAAG